MHNPRHIGHVLRVGLAACLLAPLVLAAGAGSATAQSQRSLASRTITAEEIERSKARTAWEALRRVVPHLSMTEGPLGIPGRIRVRGQPSMVVESQPVIVLNGIRLGDLAVLWAIPAESIETIRVLNSIDGTTLYGTNTASGVIFIETKGGRPR